MGRGGDHRPPEEEPGPEKRQMLGIVQEPMGQRRLVGGGQMPEPERERVREPRHGRPRQGLPGHPERGAPRQQVPDPDARRRGQPPEHHRQRVGQQKGGRRHLDQQQVLDHVDEEQILRQPVHGREQRDAHLPDPREAADEPPGRDA